MLKQFEISQELERCSRCGSCMAVCPVYRETGEEGMVARGKLSLIEANQRGELHQSRKFQELMEACLLCSGCVHQCANSVRVDKIIQWQRSRLRRDGKAGWTASLAASTLEAVGKWPMLVSQAGSLAQALFCKKIPAESGLQLRFSLAVLSQRRYVPKLSASPFLAQLPVNRLGSGPRVGLFVGCVGNYIATEVSEATVELLRRGGFQVVIPAEQRCCGMAAWASGDVATASVLAQHNSEVFLKSGCQWIVSACGTCTTQLSVRMPELLEQTAPNEARFLSQKSMDLMAFLTRQLGPEKLGQMVKSPGSLKLSYHDPCHLRYHQGIFREPRQLLSLLSEIHVAELSDTQQCCGHGGLFNVSNYRLSNQINARRMAQVEKVGPEVLATGCMGCLLQLQEGNWRHGLGLTVCHLAEVLMGRVAR
ncbi:MAG: (Fe-S)-binding protein [Syntrophobacterales bacterium]|jgi:glycolate oxidase iron-sulfur subunit